MTQPELFIVGGPNGCGKTTLALQYSQLNGMPYLGADMIAERINPDDPAAVAVKAGRLLSKQLASMLERGESVILESTLSGVWLRKPILIALDRGYRVTIAFVFLNSSEACLARIRERVAKGGHNIPAADVVRRFGRSLRNFQTVYRHLASEWMLFYNGGSEVPTLVATGVGEEAFVEEEMEMEKFLLLSAGKGL